MWAEARKQERKIRGIMVDHKKRAERRREYYEKIVSISLKLYLPVCPPHILEENWVVISQILSFHRNKILPNFFKFLVELVNFTLITMPVEMNLPTPCKYESCKVNILKSMNCFIFFSSQNALARKLPDPY